MEDPGDYFTISVVFTTLVVVPDVPVTVCGRTAHRAAAIVQDGKEIDYIFADRGIPGSGVAKKQ